MPARDPSGFGSLGHKAWKNLENSRCHKEDHLFLFSAEKHRVKSERSSGASPELFTCPSLDQLALFYSGCLFVSGEFSLTFPLFPSKENFIHLFFSLK